LGASPRVAGQRLGGPFALGGTELAPAYRRKSGAQATFTGFETKQAE